MPSRADRHHGQAPDSAADENRPGPELQDYQEPARSSEGLGGRTTWEAAHRELLAAWLRPGRIHDLAVGIEDLIAER